MSLSRKRRRRIGNARGEGAPTPRPTTVHHSPQGRSDRDSAPQAAPERPVPPGGAPFPLQTPPVHRPYVTHRGRNRSLRIVPLPKGGSKEFGFGPGVDG